MKNLPKALPTYDRRKDDLMVGEPFYKWNRQENRELIPVVDLKAIVSEVDRVLAPASKDDVLNAAQMLVGSFPGNQVKEPETYIKSLVFVISEYPVDILRIGVMELIKECEWIPAVAKVGKKMNTMVFKRAQVRNRAILQLEEHERRKEVD